MEHLPECKALDVMPEATTMFHSTSRQWFWEHGCICDRLRACERRIWRDPILVVAQNNGYREALIDAREAVEAIRDALQRHYRIDCEPVGEVDWSQHRRCDPVDDILAAIDALKETNVNA